MVSTDARFVLDCARGLPSAIARFRRLRGELEPMYLSVAARAAIVAYARGRDEGLWQRARELLDSVESLDIDSESIRCAAEIAEELALKGRRLDGVDLFVAAAARQHDPILVSRNANFGRVAGLVCQPY